MQALFIALYMHHLEPVQRAPEWAYRLELAEAIVAATPDPGKQLLLVRIAWRESRMREDVGRCRVLGLAGDRTAFQIVPRGKADRARLCSTLAEDARLAVERVDESLRCCRHLPPAERLAIYARGSCASAEGQKLSRHRWPPARDVALYQQAISGKERDDE